MGSGATPLPTSAHADGPDRLPQPAPDWAFFLDVDGTLVEIAAAPHAVTVKPGLVPTLARLAEATGGAVALVSGRRIDDLDRLLAPLRLPVAGLHGLERRRPDGRIIRHEVPREALARARAALQRFADAHPGTAVEDKGATVALHYRQAPQVAEAARAAAERALAALGDGFDIQSGKMVLEIRPRGPHKGTVIRAFMGEPPFAGRTPVFAGDDVTDEDGFAAVNHMGGISIRVGRDGATAAAWRLAAVDELLAWLAGVADTLSAAERPTP